MKVNAGRPDHELSNVFRLSNVRASPHSIELFQVHVAYTNSLMEMLPLVTSNALQIVRRLLRCQNQEVPGPRRVAVDLACQWGDYRQSQPGQLFHDY